jgi:hypothetical protein
VLASEGLTDTWNLDNVLSSILLFSSEVWLFPRSRFRSLSTGSLPVKVNGLPRRLDVPTFPGKLHQKATFEIITGTSCLFAQGRGLYRWHAEGKCMQRREQACYTTMLREGIKALACLHFLLFFRLNGLCRMDSSAMQCCIYLAEFGVRAAPHMHVTART